MGVRQYPAHPWFLRHCLGIKYYAKQLSGVTFGNVISYIVYFMQMILEYSYIIIQSYVTQLSGVIYFGNVISYIVYFMQTAPRGTQYVSRRCTEPYGH